MAQVMEIINLFYAGKRVVFRASPVPRFRINGEKSITCLDCNRTSYNLNDVRHRYCGHCHVFHDEHA